LISDEIFAAQKDLIVVMGELATAPSDRERYVKDGFQLTTSAMVDRITAVIFDLEKDKKLYPKDWVIPGATTLSAALDSQRNLQAPGDRCISLFPGVSPKEWQNPCWIFETRTRVLQFSHRGEMQGATGPDPGRR
jgi:hypothetical protein